jgi:hypothetical protein
MQVSIRYTNVNINCKRAIILKYMRRLANSDAMLILGICNKDATVKLLRQDPTYYLVAGETYSLVRATEELKESLLTRSAGHRHQRGRKSTSNRQGQESGPSRGWRRKTQEGEMIGLSNIFVTD